MTRVTFESPNSNTGIEERYCESISLKGRFVELKSGHRYRLIPFHRIIEIIEITEKGLNHE